MKKRKLRFLLFLVIIYGILICINIEKRKEMNNIDKIPILTFHRIVPTEVKERKYKNDQWVGSVKQFEEMMKYISDNNFKTISADEFYDWYIGKKAYDNKTVMITFDDGYYDEYYYVYPILKKYNLKATSFIVGDRVEKITPKWSEEINAFYGWDKINEIRNEYPNLDFQSHSYGLHGKIKNSYRVNKASKEKLLEDINNQEKFSFKYIAYPYGKFTEEYQKLLKENGYLLGFGFENYKYATKKDNQYNISRVKINGDADLEYLKSWIEY